MQKLKYKNEPIVVLFGGAGRENVIFKLIKRNFNLKKIIFPSKLSVKLKKSFLKLEKTKVGMIKTKPKQLIAVLKKYKKCALLSVGFPYIIPEEILSNFTLALNLHPTLLPKYRGPSTGAYILMNNEKKTGSTIHLMTKEVDGGDILGRDYVKLNAFDTIKSMQKKVYRLEPNLILSVFKKLKKGLKTVKQNKKYALTFKKVRKPEDSKINFHKPLINLINEIRACDAKKFPAYFIYKKQKVCIKLWRPNKSKKQNDEL